MTSPPMANLGGVRPLREPAVQPIAALVQQAARLGVDGKDNRSGAASSILYGCLVLKYTKQRLNGFNAKGHARRRADLLRCGVEPSHGCGRVIQAPPWVFCIENH